ncbi:carbon monoxide dehydrogenase [Streptomyces sp. NPDC020875]|uniref:carbon monoxide dehydrogenase n=1 Tax=Streptomyces sp. NPDC020875 TaxID=3154898 RepID=UPI00340D2ABC
MEHEVFVPVPAETVRGVLGDPVRAARCVPGFRPDAEADGGGDDDGDGGTDQGAAAGSGGVPGRLKIRVGSQTITYRGVLRIAGHDGEFTVDGDGTEARGDGSARIALTVRTTAVEGGTNLAFAGTVAPEGRLAEASDAVRESAARRLLDRFAEAVAAESAAGAVAGGGDGGGGDAGAGDGGDGAPNAGTTEAGSDDGDGDTVDGDVVDGDGVNDRDDDGTGGEERAEGVAFEAVVPPVPPPGLADELTGPVGDEPVAEAAHARRTMIGRSAEEVDHAPPRGRYAPRPAPDAGRAGPPARWLVPAAAVALASAIAVTRVLRRRRSG